MLLRKTFQRVFTFFFFLLLRMKALALLKMAESTHYHISSLSPKKLSYIKRFSAKLTIQFEVEH